MCGKKRHTKTEIRSEMLDLICGRIAAGENYNLTRDTLQDIKNTKTYILKTFKYREYAENFSQKIKVAIKALDPFAEGYEKTGFIIENRVLKDRMYW